MSTPTCDNAFLYELELTVRAELTLAEASQKNRPTPYRATSGRPTRMSSATKSPSGPFSATSRP